jgi:proteasome lid subunit RPN8/RPN11
MKTIEIPGEVINEMIAHAKEGYPNEICGILAGKDFASSHAYRMKNTEPSPVSYIMDPKEQLLVEKDIRKREEEMLAIYHSHPNSGAYPSAKDAREAYQWNWNALYIIIGKVKEDPEVRAFSINDGNIDEIAVKPL